MDRQIGITRIPVLVVILLLIMPITTTSINNEDHQRNFVPSETHSFLLDALTWNSFQVHCLAGDVVFGEFSLTNNGDLFIGDQTKYDNWLLDGINFIILDEYNYEMWLDGNPIESLFEKEGVVELSWSVDIPSNGVWYIIYYNDSIFMKQLEGNIQHISQNGFTYFLISAGLLGLAILPTLIFIFRKKK